jgi:hypothetical protein
MRLAKYLPTCYLASCEEPIIVGDEPEWKLPLRRVEPRLVTCMAFTVPDPSSLGASRT